jgi:predicted outer membrane repeat protein
MVIDSCLFVDNVSANDGGAVFSQNAWATVTGSTFVDNLAVFRGGLFYAYNVGTTTAVQRVFNCIAAGNVAGYGSSLAAEGEHEVRVAYSNIEDGSAGVWYGSGVLLLWGLGNIDTDPVFMDAAAGDFRLFAFSPCVDAGDNFACFEDLDLDGNSRRVDDPLTPDTGLGDPPIVDMGAYEYGAALLVLVGDVNCNGVLGFDDINPFVIRLSNPTAYALAYPDCPDANGDINGSGTVDFADINPFVAALTAR